MEDKIVTDDILQKAIQDTIQIIADNIFEFESYSDESIAELFSLTPEEAQHISDLIADTVISQYKLWSSKKVSDELLSAKNECNDYTDDRLSGISSISLKYCEELPDVGESNCIYILKSTDSNPDTLNLYDSDNTTWISIGDFNISLDDVYKISEIDAKLDLKANKTEILAQDDVITDTSLATTSNVLSATTTIEELDKKVDKASIATTIDENSTDDTVASAKAVYDNAIKNNNIKTYTDITQLGLTTPTTVGAIYNAIPANSCLNIFASLSSVTDLPLQQGLLSITKISTAGFDIIFKRSGSSSISDNAMYIGQLKGVDGTGLSWKKVCTTKVADVPITDITIPNGLFQTVDSDSSYIKYEVVNGIAFVYFSIRGAKLVSSGISRNITVPKLKTSFNHTIIGEGCSSNLTILANGTCMQIWALGDEIVTTNYSGCISYPVAES